MFVTFLSDFGLQDDFVGTCHGVIKRIAPEAQIIDVTHGIPPQQVLQGALVLASTLPYMPVGVHLAVVDPGVGSSRRPLALRDRIGQRHGSDESLCVRVFGVSQDLVSRALLHQSTAMHHRDPVREDVDDREVVADEQTGALQALLQLLQQVHAVAERAP